MENAVAYMLDQRYLVEEDKKLKLGPAAPDVAACKQFAEEIRRYLRHQR
jgi:glycerol-3-phosphate O-acyltransferase